MSWTEIKVAHAKLLGAAKDPSDDLRLAWQEFEDVVQKTSENPPYHLRSILKTIGALASDDCKSEIAILDHGCGSAATLLYLAARGYTNIYGVDVGGPCENLNRLTGDVFGSTTEKFFVYDGQQLPLEDDSIDVVISQEVLEHVGDAQLESYYSEEVRVLRPGGLAVHSVPHRLVPYDSHSRTWFMHWVLPRTLWVRAVQLIGRSTGTVEHALFLRWPGAHKKMLRKYFVQFSDVTKNRLLDLTDFEYYDGNLSLRVLIARLVALPFIGVLFVNILSNFVMLDTVSRK